jgi:hypothetical protein
VRENSILIRAVGQTDRIHALLGSHMPNLEFVEIAKWNKTVARCTSNPVLTHTLTSWANLVPPWRARSCRVPRPSGDTRKSQIWGAPF